jgi:hypothetical protein
MRRQDEREGLTDHRPRFEVARSLPSGTVAVGMNGEAGLGFRAAGSGRRIASSHSAGPEQRFHFSHPFFIFRDLPAHKVI